MNNSQLRERVERQKLNESIEIKELERQLEELSVASTKVGGDKEEVKEKRRKELIMM